MNEIRSVQIECPLCGSTAHLLQTLVDVERSSDPVVTSSDPDCTNEDCLLYRP